MAILDMDHKSKIFNPETTAATDTGGGAFSSRTRAAVKLYQAVAAACLPPVEHQLHVVVDEKPQHPAQAQNPVTAGTAENTSPTAFAAWGKLSTNTSHRHAVAPQATVLPSSRADIVTLG